MTRQGRKLRVAIRMHTSRLSQALLLRIAYQESYNNTISEYEKAISQYILQHLDESIAFRIDALNKYLKQFNLTIQ